MEQRHGSTRNLDKRENSNNLKFKKKLKAQKYKRFYDSFKHSVFVFFCSIRKEWQ